MAKTNVWVNLWLGLAACTTISGLKASTAVHRSAFLSAPFEKRGIRSGLALKRTCKELPPACAKFPCVRDQKSGCGRTGHLRMQIDIGQSLFNLERVASAGVSAELQNVSPTSAILIFVAGILTSLSPCALSVLPFTVGYIGGIADGKRSAFAPSFSFSMGLATSLCGLGLAASLLGKVYGAEGSGVAAVGPILSAGLYILFGLSLLDVIQLPSLLPSASSLVPDQDACSQAPSEGYGADELLRAFTFGASSALVASPCATPVLASLLAYISANKMDPVGGTGLLLAYSTGYTAPILAAGLATGALKSLLALKASFRWVTPMSGAMLVAYGTYSALDHLVPV